MRSTWARWWFGSTAVAAFVGILVQSIVAAGESGAEAKFPTAVGRVFNVFCYFTIQSNLLVGVICLLLAIRLGRSSTLFRTLRLTSVVMIVVTAIVYHALLAASSTATGWALFGTTVLHTVVPILAVVGWLVFGPRGMIEGRVAVLSVILPLCWLAFALVRGALIHFYPYDFLDVDELGYPRTLLNCAGVAVFYVALTAGATAVDRRLTPRGTAVTDPSPG